MSRKSSNDLEKAVQEFNRVTGRPDRAYNPDQECVGGAANIGYAYTRNLGEQDDHRVAVSIIINHGGGVTNIHGLVGHPTDVLRELRRKLSNPEWVKANQFDGGRWRPNPPIAHMPVDILQKVVTRGVTLQVLVIGEGASLRFNSGLELASHPNPHSCHCLMQRILQESEERALEQAGYIENCGGRVDRDLIVAVANHLHAPPKESVTGAFLESLSKINQP